MNPFASVTFAWLTVYVFILAKFAFVGLFRRPQAEARCFGALLGLGVLYDLASVLRYGHDPVGLIPWEQVRVAAGLGSIPVHLDLALRLSGAYPAARRWLFATYAWSAVAVTFALLGVIIDAHSLVQRAVLGPYTIEYREAVASPLGQALMLPAVLAGLVATTFYFIRAARAQGRWMWGVALSYFLVACAVVHDATTGVTHLPSPFLVEHFMFIHLGALSFAFTARMAEAFVGRDAELARVRVALEQREALAAVGELSAIVAHEVRNPLAIILNAVASLRRPQLSPRERDLLHGILEEEADRINRIVTDLLTLARPLHPEARATLPRELIARCLGPAERAGTEVDLRSSPDAEAPIHCDAHLLRHALENVIENAVQAMGTGGMLTITLTRKTRQGVAGREIAVIDTGEGMNTEVRNSARKAFFTTRTTGTGLGLAIVDRILTAHRGAVDIESSRGEGTTVRLFVPEPAVTPTAP
ncbi:MAG: Sensor protein of zinc sigma-54-dependent two-component system [Myxococcaceae bacterium]|nr:Sensor protein of zinc sigma-54-dependent two-component system [Myxococcaceae bacterium]